MVAIRYFNLAVRPIGKDEWPILSEFIKYIKSLKINFTTPRSGYYFRKEEKEDMLFEEEIFSNFFSDLKHKFPTITCLIFEMNLEGDAFINTHAYISIDGNNFRYEKLDSKKIRMTDENGKYAIIDEYTELRKEIVLEFADDFIKKIIVDNPVWNITNLITK